MNIEETRNMCKKWKILLKIDEIEKTNSRPAPLLFLYINIPRYLHSIHNNICYLSHAMIYTVIDPPFY